MIRRMLRTCGVTAASLLAGSIVALVISPGSAAASAALGGAGVSYGISCSNSDGVLKITLSNVGSEGLATFRITDPRTSQLSEIDVEPGSPYVMKVDGLSDGPVTVPILADGQDTSISVVVKCDRSTEVQCPAGSTRVGSQCVAVVGNGNGPKVQSFPALPATGGRSGGLWIGAALVACGATASLASRRRR